MPTPVPAARQCLAPAAVTALDAAVASARRRAHAQTTSLHLIASLLSPTAAPLLRDALARARSAAYSQRLQLKALALCFAVSLDRLPSTPTSSVSASASNDQHEPPVANSLMAAIKRSQANQRRNPDTFHLYHHHHQAAGASATSPNAVKVDLFHLVLAILDDPLVSRVFADAGFRSNEIKVAILRPAPPVPLLGRGLPHPTRARPPPLFLCSFAAADDADVPSPAPALAGAAPGEDNCRRITDILARGRNPMLVGVGAASAAADFANASPYRIHPVNHQTDLLAVAAAPTTPGSGLIFSIGDLKDLVPDEADLQDAARRVVAEVTRLLETHRAAGRQTVWVMGWSATYETYLAFLSKFPLVDKDWELQLLPITAVRDAGPAAGLVPPPAPATTVGALSMPATTSFMESFVPFGGFMCDTYEANSLTANSCPQALRCQQCNDRYEQEAATIIRGSGITAEAHQEGLPSLLQNGSMMGPNNGFDAIKVRDDQMVLSTKIQNLKKKWNEYCLRLHQGCNRTNRDPCQLFRHHIDVRVDRERCANPNQSSQSVALQREVIRPSAVSSPHTNTTAKSISAPSISTQMNADLVLNLQVRQSKTDEPLQDRAVPSQHSNSSNCDNPEDHVSPSSAAPVATDLVLATPRGSSSKDSSNALCKHVEDAEGSIQLMPKKVDDLNRKPPHFSAQPYTCFRSSSNWDQTSPSALHSAASGGASAFGQWQRPSPLAAQSYDLSNYKLLMERLFKAVGRQEEALSAICASIVQCRSMERRRGASKKNDIWFSFYGPDGIAKRRVGVALAELMHSSSENLIYLDLSLHDWDNPNFRGKRATDCIAEELRKKRRSVIFLDNIEKADCLVQQSLIHAMETGRYKDLHGGQVADLNDSIVVLSTRMNQGCQDASLGMEEGNAFSEEKVVAARGNQLKIIVEPSTANISGGPGGKVVVSSRHCLINSQASLYSSSFSKRKLHISDGQEKTSQSPSTSKRLHRTSSVPFDLNLPGDEAEAQDGDDDSSSSHENSSGDPEGSLGSLLRSVDESINFKPFDFGKLCEDILQEFSSTMSKTLGSRCRLEIDAVAMEQVVAAAWAFDSHEKRPVRTWVEQVFARSLEQLKVRCKNLSSCTLRLVACEDETPVKEDGFGPFQRHLHLCYIASSSVALPLHLYLLWIIHCRVLSNFSISFTVISVLTGVTMLYNTGLAFGGSATMTLGWFLAGAFTMAVRLSMAEICSAFPTSGGLYYWSARLSGHRWAPFASWITGWFNIVAQWAGTASIDFSLAQLIQVIILLSTGGNNGGGYLASKYVVFAFHAGILMSHAAINSLSITWLSLLGQFAALWNMLGVFVLMIAVPVVATERASAKYVFTHFNTGNSAGIHSNLYIFVLGLLMSQYTLSGYDASAHMTEETKNAGRNGPIGIISAIGISLVVGWGYILGITFAVKDIPFLLSPDNDAGGYAIAQVFYLAFKSRYASSAGGIVCLWIVAVAIYFCGMSSMTSNSRMTYAFSRDGAMPFSSIWHRVNKQEVPINAVWLSAFISLCMALPSLGSLVAFQAMASVTTTAVYIAYALPILFRVTLARNRFVPGPFSLGRYGVLVGWIAVLWVATITVLFSLPVSYPVTKNTLNYTPVAVGGLFTLILSSWIVSARRWFTGPVTNLGG